MFGLHRGKLSSGLGGLFAGAVSRYLMSFRAVSCVVLGWYLAEIVSCLVLRIRFRRTRCRSVLRLTVSCCFGRFFVSFGAVFCGDSAVASRGTRFRGVFWRGAYGGKPDALGPAMSALRGGGILPQAALGVFRMERGGVCRGSGPEPVFQSRRVSRSRRTVRPSGSVAVRT